MMANKTVENSRKKMQASFVLHDAEEKRHRNVVNALQLDLSNGRLYSAGSESLFLIYLCFFSNCFHEFN